MACACGTKKTASPKYLVTLPGGQQKTYQTEVEAKAAVQRAGGGSIRPA